jgi:hypothetical protein
MHYIIYLKYLIKKMKDNLIPDFFQQNGNASFEYGL